jgi:2-hydroxy-6-oxonona-2,4-dienedioate hydrolase
MTQAHDRPGVEHRPDTDLTPVNPLAALAERRLLDGRRTRVDGHSIFARIGRTEPSSAAPAVIFVPGLMVAGAFLRPAMLRLAEDYHVAAPDLPGFGASDKPDRTLTIPELADALGGWLDAQGYERAVLVGCSLGTQIVAELAAKRPEPVAGVVLLGPVMDPAARSTPKALLRWSLELPLELSQMPVMARDYARGGMGRAISTFREMLHFPIEERLPEITAPTLVLRGGWDAIVSDGWAREATAMLPDGRYRVLPRRGHSANYTAPDDFATAVRGFLRVSVGRESPANASER